MKRRESIALRTVQCAIAAIALIAAVSAASAAQPLVNKIILRDSAKPLQPFQFVDANGKSLTLADFRGKTVLLNIWATWCVPCRKEMPALDRLEAALGGPNFQVVPLSIDRGGMDVVRKFFAEIGITKLGMFLDESGEASRKLNVVGLPTTLMIDRNGSEVGRLIGPAEWDKPETIDFIKCVVDKISTADIQKTVGRAATEGCGGRVVHFPVGDTNKN